MLPDLDPSTKEMNQSSIIRTLDARLQVHSKELEDLKSVVRSKNAQIIKLEAENLRLKMARTDKELALEVEGLRRGMGTRDRGLVDLQRTIDTLKDSEIISLRRAQEAERKANTLETTLGTMQRARDRAQGECAQAEQRTQDAVAQAKEADRRVADADERAKLAVKPFEKLLVLADAIVRKSASLNRNETEVKSYREARKV